MPPKRHARQIASDPNRMRRPTPVRRVGARCSAGKWPLAASPHRLALNSTSMNDSRGMTALPGSMLLGADLGFLLTGEIAAVIYEIYIRLCKQPLRWGRGVLDGSGRPGDVQGGPCRLKVRTLHVAMVKRAGRYRIAPAGQAARKLSRAGRRPRAVKPAET